MSWHLGRMAAADTETTGVDVEADRVVTACVALVGGGHPVESVRWLADPGVEIPDEAAKIHGITTAKARAEGRPAAEVIAEVVGDLAEAQRNGVPIVAMNASYDLTMLDRECRRYGVKPLTDEVGGPEWLRVIDPRVLDKQVDRYRRGGRKLEDLCRHYGVKLDSAHNAAADAIAAARVVWRIGQTVPELAAMSLDELHTAQVRWAAEQARELADYFRRTPGKESWADGVRGEWPLIPAGGGR